MYLPILHSRSRVMLFAPHPDDESLAAGVLLQRAVGAGAAVRVVYATNGERNCWPQRLLERKVRLRAADRRRWGARRQAEARAALGVLGIAPEEAEFLSLPDQGVTDLLVDRGSGAVENFAALIEQWEPTHLLMPSAADTHPDHSGLAVLLRFAFESQLAQPEKITRLEYLIHGRSAAFARAASSLPQTAQEAEKKLRAITCHQTQVAFSRRRFLAYAQRPERFVFAEENPARETDGPIFAFAREPELLRLHGAFSLKPLRAEETSLFCIGRDPFGGLRCLRTTLPARSGKLDLIDCATGQITGIGRYWGDAFRAEMTLPTEGFAADEPIFLKLDRRAWFFDEAGWLEIGPVAPAADLPLARPQRALALA